MKSKFLILLLFVPFLLLAACREVEPRLQSKDVRLEKMGSFEEPVWLEEREGSLYVVQKGGEIIKRTGKQQSTWLDVSDEVRNSGEGGLLGLAFSPQRPDLFYLYYTDRAGDQVVSEGSTDPQPRLTREVLRMEDFASNHNGGQITFGPGGLYIATGDGGGSGDSERTAQNPQSLLGKILRILPYAEGAQPYTIPADNPFVGKADARPEIFSLGLRNPWRFSFGAGRIWIADVGQSEQEEISAPTLLRARGGNFGWSAWEGKKRYNSDQTASDPIWPVLVYGHNQGCSVTGGYLLPAGPLQGRYIYGDFCSGEIRSFRLEDGKALDDRAENLRVPDLVSFALGDKGEVWVISLGGNIWRMV